MKITRALVVMTVAFAGASAALPAGAAPFFQGLGSFGDFYEARAISADGSVVVGQAVTPLGSEPFRWSSAGGFTGLGNLPGGKYGLAYGVSADGSVIVGMSASNESSEAFRWTPGGGIVGLGVAFGDVTGVSDDGSAIVGRSSQAFRWTSEDGMVELGDLPGGQSYSSAQSVSSDGSIVVGFSKSVSGDEAFRWTSVGGMVGLGDLPGGNFYSIPLGLSENGSVVVGYGSVEQRGPSGTTLPYEAFRWTPGGGMEGLGYLTDDGFESIANAVTADGSVIVGYSNSAAGREAFRWTQESGMQSLKLYLLGQGVDTAGWQLLQAVDISGDGTTIVGNGINPLGHMEGFIAHTTAVPEPASFALVLAGLGVLGVTARRRAA